VCGGGCTTGVCSVGVRVCVCGALQVCAMWGCVYVWCTTGVCGVVWVCVVWVCVHGVCVVWVSADLGVWCTC